MAVQNFHRLVCSARFYKKMVSRGCCVSVFDSSGKLVVRPEDTGPDNLCSSGTEFVVGRATSDEVVFGATTGVPMEIPLNL